MYILVLIISLYVYIITGFITFDTSIHFYNLKSTLKSPHMLVLSDITDVIMPSPEDLLVNLQDSRVVVDSLLDSLSTMFQVCINYDILSYNNYCNMKLINVYV
jgi:hypothetical protein